MSSLPPDSGPPRPDADSDRLRTVARYSGIGVQMAATIGLSTWAGYWLDQHFQSKTPWFTLGLMLLGLFAALYNVIRAVSKGE